MDSRGYNNNSVVWVRCGKGRTVKRTLLIPSFSSLLAVGFSTGCFSEAPGANAGISDAKALGVARCLTAEDANGLADGVLQLINLERAEAGVAPVVTKPALQKIADNYACRMIEEGFFGHRDPVSGYGPGERAIIGKYSYYAVGENLAAGQETAADVVRVWMESSSHKAIILDERWTEIGIGVRLGGQYSIYWVQVFGDPAQF